MYSLHMAEPGWAQTYETCETYRSISVDQRDLSINMTEKVCNSIMC